HHLPPAAAVAYGRGMLLAEDILLLLTEDQTGKAVVDTATLELALAGAVLLELALAGRVDVAGPGEAGKPGRVVVRDAPPAEDPLPAAALARIAGVAPRKLDSLLSALKKGPVDEVRARLVHRGILRWSRAVCSASSRPTGGPLRTPATRTPSAAPCSTCSSRAARPPRSRRASCRSCSPSTRSTSCSPARASRAASSRSARRRSRRAASRPRRSARRSRRSTPRSWPRSSPRQPRAAPQQPRPDRPHPRTPHPHPPVSSA